MSDHGVVATIADTHPENREDALIEWVMDERGLAADGAKYRTDLRTLSSADIVVYLDAEEPHDLAGRTYVQWAAPTTDGMGIEQIRTFADDMETRVADLLTELGVPVRTLQGEELLA